MITDAARGARIDLEYRELFRYRCRGCHRQFMVRSREQHESGAVRCPECASDDVAHWLSRRDRLMRFLMFYEAA